MGMVKQARLMFLMMVMMTPGTTRVKVIHHGILMMVKIQD